MYNHLTVCKPVRLKISPTKCAYRNHNMYEEDLALNNQKV